MNPVNYDDFFSRMNDLESAIGETELFIHYGEGDRVYCFIGCCEKFSPPYWIGYTRPTPPPFTSRTFEELADAPEFHGKTLREIWDQIEWISMDGVGPEDQFDC